MHKDTHTMLQTFPIQRKRTKKVPKICHAFFTIKALATNPKPMRPRALCTGISVRHVLPMAKPLLTQRPSAKTNLEKVEHSSVEHSRLFSEIFTIQKSQMLLILVMQLKNRHSIDTTHGLLFRRSNLIRPMIRLYLEILLRKSLPGMLQTFYSPLQQKFTISRHDLVR